MNEIPFVNPRSGMILEHNAGQLLDPKSNERFPIINGIPRFCEVTNYSQSFGFQWGIFEKTQLDRLSNSKVSEVRFYAETGWCPSGVSGLSVLEVGSGAGRFSEVFLRTTSTRLYSIDYSSAVDVNRRNNFNYRDRLHLAQASIYEMPFPDDSFDKVFCLGVLQHTPYFDESVKAIVRKSKIGGEMVVDFYPINGWYTKIHSKYILRPITKRLPQELLLTIIRANIGWMLSLFDVLARYKLGILTRFIPVTDVRNFPKSLTKEQRLEWAVMDTFDGFSPEFDNPQRLASVIRMFSDSGCRVTFAGQIDYVTGVSTVVRAVKES